MLQKYLQNPGLDPKRCPRRVISNAKSIVEHLHPLSKGVPPSNIVQT